MVTVLKGGAGHEWIERKSKEGKLHCRDCGSSTVQMVKSKHMAKTDVREFQQELRGNT